MTTTTTTERQMHWFGNKREKMNWICWLSVLFQCFCLETENFVNVIIEFFDIFLPKTVLSQRNRAFPLICFVSVIFCTCGVDSQGNLIWRLENRLCGGGGAFETKFWASRASSSTSCLMCVVRYQASVYVAWKRMPFDLSTKFLSLKWQISNTSTVA